MVVDDICPEGFILELLMVLLHNIIQQFQKLYKACLKLVVHVLGGIEENRVWNGDKVLHPLCELYSQVVFMLLQEFVIRVRGFLIVSIALVDAKAILTDCVHEDLDAFYLDLILL